MKLVGTAAPRVALVALVFGALSLSSSVAYAGGFEFQAPGTRALGRGGAFMARPDDPMALYYNPAALASLSGIQLSLQTHLAFYSSCFQRSGTYAGNVVLSPGEPSIFEEPDSPYQEVCNSGAPGVIPELVLSWRVHEKVGLALGLVAPSAVGTQQYGETTTINGRTVQGIAGGLPAASRYMLIDQNLIIAFPSIGIGVAAHPRLHFGLAFGSGFGIFNYTTTTRALPGEDFGADLLTELSATDAFIPRITASVHAIPHDNLDIAFTFTWTDNVVAEGETRLESGHYQEMPLGNLTIPGTRLYAPQPWSVDLGVRYGHRIAPRSRATNLNQLSGQVEDEMSNERFDIELNVGYQRNSGVDRFRTEFSDHPAPDAAACRADPTCSIVNGDQSAWAINVPVFGLAPLPPSVDLAHQWKDQLTIRLGGDYNILPGFLAARAGVSYETSGVTEGFQQLDFLPVQRFGIHLGATMRFGNFDLSLAYAHLFQTTVEVTEGQIEQVDASNRRAELSCDPGDECVGDFGPPTIQNNGRIESSFDVFSLGLTYHFR